MRTKIFYLILFAVYSCSNNENSQTDSATPTYKITSLVDSNSLKGEKLEPFTEKNKVDTAKLLELQKFVTLKKDVFKQRIFYHSKTEPRFRNQNGVYCYFSADSSYSSIGYLRFVFQYYAEDWLFIKNYRFLIDGNVYTFTPENVERDNASGDIWEWSDDLIKTSDATFIEALANAKEAKVRIEGSTYSKEKKITAQQLQSIKIMYELHKAMGGKYYSTS